jgi:ornithine cyclodeaminase/alanine dehydrogenase-like protein (mu-crystallin family)
MPDAIEAMREAFFQLTSGHVVMPPRGAVDFPEQNGTLLLMPCAGGRNGRFTVKLVSLFTDNHERDLPLIHSLLVLSDATTGMPLAICDGAVITAIRTAAASGLATQHLALPNAQCAAIFGAGVQARTQLEAVCAVRPIERARVYDVHREAAELFATQMSELLGIEVQPAESPAEALESAHVVCTVTTSGSAVFRDGQLAPGTHINAVGSYKPHVVEIPPETVRRADVVVDQREAALEEAGDLLTPIREGIITPDHIRAELGELLTGRASGRRDDEQITLFKSVGLAVQDLFAVQRALENARRLGLGRTLPR